MKRYTKRQEKQAKYFTSINSLFLVGQNIIKYLQTIEKIDDKPWFEHYQQNKIEIKYI